MITFSTNQRRSVNWNGSNWVEEVLAASGVGYEYQLGEAIVLSGAVNAQQALVKLEDLFESYSNLNSTTTGIEFIDEVVNVSGITQETIDSAIDVFTFASGSESILRFSAIIPDAPDSAPLWIRLNTVARAAASGYVQYEVKYNIFAANADVTPGSSVYANTDNIYQYYTASDLDTIKLVNIEVPNSLFTGSSPHLLVCQISRKTSVANNYNNNVSVTDIWLDNVKGSLMPNKAGYTGGALTINGTLEVTGDLILTNQTVPTSATDTGTAGSIVVADDFLYVATATNTWKRIPLSWF
jgi:hypothetical protein